MILYNNKKLWGNFLSCLISNNFPNQVQSYYITCKMDTFIISSQIWLELLYTTTNHFFRCWTDSDYKWYRLFDWKYSLQKFHASSITISKQNKVIHIEIALYFHIYTVFIWYVYPFAISHRFLVFDYLSIWGSEHRLIMIACKYIFFGLLLCRWTKTHMHNA